MIWARLIATGSSILLSSSLFALPQNCRHSFGSAFLEVNKEARQNQREYTLGGRQAAVGDLSDLAAGKYIYLIDEDRTVFWSPLIPDYLVDPNSDDPLYVSHRSLIARAKLSRGVDTFIAAGEFAIIDWKGRRIVQELNNRSNTLRGGLLNLLLAEDILRHYGLPVSEDTALLDYAKRNVRVDLHMDQEEKVLVYLKWRDSPDFHQFLEILNRLQELYPDSSKVGSIDAINLGWRLTQIFLASSDEKDIRQDLWALNVSLPNVDIWSPAVVFERLIRDGISLESLTELLDQYIFKQSSPP